MKKLIRVITILILTIFSFYYTDKIVYLSKMNDPLMVKIIDYKNKTDKNPENGILTKDAMFVGSSGRKVNINKSYEKMKTVNDYNENLFEYDRVLPIIRKKNNLDKLIKGKSGNEKNISFVFRINSIDELDEISYILSKNKAKATFFIDGKILEDNILNLNSNFKENISFGYYGYQDKYDFVSLKYVKGMLEISNLRVSNYCLYKNDEYLNSCVSNKINTISPTFISSNLYNYIKFNKESGYIYEVSINKYNIRELNSSIMYLKGRGYDLIFLDELLKE